MTTFTASTFDGLPRAVHAGVNHLSIFYNHGANSTSANDVILLAKLPNGARVLDFSESHSSGAASCALDFGWASGANSGGGADLSALGAALALNTRNNLQAGKLCPPVVSVSDNDPNKYGILAAKIATAGTTTINMSIRFMLTYEVTGGTQ
jgi:hypothetical protein